MDYKLYYRKFRNGTILVITLVLISKAPRLLTLFPFAMCLAKVHLAYETTIWTLDIQNSWHLLQTLHLSISNCFAITPSFTKQKNLQQSMSTNSVGNFWVAHVKSISVSSFFILTFSIKIILNFTFCTFKCWIRTVFNKSMYKNLTIYQKPEVCSCNLLGVFTCSYI